MSLVLVGNYFKRVFILSRYRPGRYQQRTDFRQNRQYNMGSDTENHLVWVDLEMTGLDDQKDKILEIACLITDTNLNVIAEGPDIIIHQPKSVLESMGDWCRKHHGESGLTKAVLESKTSVEDAEDMVLNFVKEHTTPKRCLLAGNSVHVDKMFLTRYMPKFVDHLHYRIIDVSTVKELCKHWYPEAFLQAPRKAGSHRALDDIKESLAELKFYRSAVFK
ncbi:oligoribonuclease, mitochondrial-like [Dendronephthya gigantea]|uniref:oligoribonuclease, mitochondrial-like n=1 Tax=Dendronephthya gigantea TaxID=151771 RepID=UPI001068E3DF|nr:oligoribonuclease, mitochondrial-like [Dendronephthya gigantea]